MSVVYLKEIDLRNSKYLNKFTSNGFTNVSLKPKINQGRPKTVIYAHSPPALDSHHTLTAAVIRPYKAAAFASAPWYTLCIYI